MTQLPLALPPASGDLPLTTITYCRRCGAVVVEQEAIRSNTADYCTVTCRQAHREADHG